MHTYKSQTYAHYSVWCHCSVAICLPVYCLSSMSAPPLILSPNSLANIYLPKCMENVVESAHFSVSVALRCCNVPLDIADVVHHGVWLTFAYSTALCVRIECFLWWLCRVGVFRRSFSLTDSLTEWLTDLTALSSWKQQIQQKHVYVKVDHEFIVA